MQRTLKLGDLAGPICAVVCCSQCNYSGASVRSRHRPVDSIEQST